MNTSVVDFYYSLMRKIFIIKRRFDVAGNTAVYIFCYGVMGEPGNSCMAVPAGDIFMRSIGINIFVNIVTPFSSKLVDPTDLRILMSHETIFFVRGICTVTVGKNQEEE